jgi:GNAT superfamily N-acetyltransferase
MSPSYGLLKHLFQCCGVRMAPHMIRLADRPGDLGWVVRAHGQIYADQFGWDSTFEALVATIVGDYGNHHDPSREQGWIAEVDGKRVGCIFCVATDDPTTAKLRILLVDPAVRGCGIGQALVGACVEFARRAGYKQMVLWTNDVLVSARRIYQAYGFRLIEELPHHSFGHDLVGQTWALQLHRTADDGGQPATRCGVQQ